MIEVKQNYGGRLTKEQRIAPGIYTDDDPALFGIADYLVNSGYAVRIEEPKAVEVKADELPMHTGASEDGVIKSSKRKPNRRR
jgi:hypothetical protein